MPFSLPWLGLVGLLLISPPAPSYWNALEWNTFSGLIAYHVYTSYNALDSEIFLYNGKSKKTTPVKAISNAVLHAHNPKFSDDGKYLVFAGLPHDYNQKIPWRTNLRIYSYELETQQVRDLSTALNCNACCDEDPSFLPRSHVVVFKRRSTELWQTNIDTLNAERFQIHVDGEKSMPIGLENPRSIVFALGSGATSKLYRHTPHMQTTEALATPPRIQSYYPSFLPPDRLAFVRWKTAYNKNDQIYEMNIKDGKSQPSSCNQAKGNQSDPFRVNTVWLGLSSTHQTSNYSLYLCYRTSGSLISIAHHPGKHVLGGTYHPGTP